MILLLAVLLAGCKKSFLEAKPDKALLVPTTAADLRALLDNIQVFNNTPGLTALADGDTFTTSAGWVAYSTDAERNSYLWAKDIFTTEAPSDWRVPYQQVFYSNVVLDAPPADAALKGTALFYRGYAFFNLAQQFAAPYDAGTATELPGIPLKISSDVTERSGRGTLQQTYERIVADLRLARQLLPATSAYKSRPTTTAAFGLLARVYLAMEDYRSAEKYADSCLAQAGPLLDYNTLNAAATRPFPPALPNGNSEVIWYSVLVAYSFNSSSSPTTIVPELYDRYAADDLRKTVLFRNLGNGTYKFKGNYSGVIPQFSGLATDEQYFIRAECRARRGETAGALADLNTVLEKRWKAGTFVPFAAADDNAALALVLAEKRKSLTGRGLRWADLRRLTKDSRFATQLQRELNGAVYALSPNSSRYVYPLPAEEVAAGLAQNSRE